MIDLVYVPFLVIIESTESQWGKIMKRFMRLRIYISICIYVFLYRSVPGEVMSSWDMNKASFFFFILSVILRDCFS